MDRNLTGFGEEIVDYKFDGILDWLIKIKDPREQWRAQPTYLLSEWTFILNALLTFIHSQRVGGRFRWLWLTTVLHGVFVENVTFWFPQIDNFWHSQTTVVLFGRRLPIHIMCLYPTFIYTASVCVSRLRLGRLASAVAVGLTVVLIDIPYDIMAVKFVHWTWHDTDPNIYDRHYWVPWTSYYFHATFAATLSYMFFFWRRRLCENDPENQWVSDRRKSREFLCCVLTALCGMPGGVIQFLPIYHPLHDYFGIHTENCVFTLFVIYFMIAWNCDRNPIVGSRPTGNRGLGINEIVLGLILHYSCYLGMVLYGNPEYEVSIGLHEKIGPCDKWEEQETIFTLFTGETAKRRKYLCPEFDEQYFDFKCINAKNTFPKLNSEWYTICGNPFPNRAEYIQVIVTICFLAFMVFRAMLFRSGAEWDTTPKVAKAKKNK